MAHNLYFYSLFRHRTAKAAARIKILCTSWCFALFFAPNATQAQDTVKMTLDSCLRYAYAHNTTLLNAQLNRETAIATLSGAKMKFLPSLSASASQGWSWNSTSSHNANYGVNGNLVLFNGLSSLRTYQQAKLSQQQSDLTWQQSQNTISSRIISAYLTILMNEERLSYQQEVLETSRQQKLEGELKYQVGRILESDYQLLEANHLSAQAEIENTRIIIDNNRHELHDLLCMPSGQTVATIPPHDSLSAGLTTPPPYEAILAASKQALPDWQLGKLNVDIARYNVELSKSSFMPTLALNAGLNYMQGTTGVMGNAGGYIPATGGLVDKSVTLGLNIPLFDRGATITQYRKSKLSLRQAELNYQQDTIDIEAALHKQYNEVLQAQNSYRKAEALAHAYHSSYTVYVLKYKEGAITTVEMLQQQDKYLAALNDYLQSKYTLILAQKQLDIYTGKEITL